MTIVEGLHLTCDFLIHSAALFGCEPNYEPTPVLIHQTFREPYQVLGAIPFDEYAQFAQVATMDDLTLEAIQRVNTGRMRDFTCIVWELDSDLVRTLGSGEAITNDQKIDRVANARRADNRYSAIVSIQTG